MAFFVHGAGEIKTDRQTGQDGSKEQQERKMIQKKEKTICEIRLVVVYLDLVDSLHNERKEKRDRKCSNWTRSQERGEREKTEITCALFFRPYAQRSPAFNAFQS